jgi:hypothetical protein
MNSCACKKPDLRSFDGFVACAGYGASAGLDSTISSLSTTTPQSSDDNFNFIYLITPHSTALVNAMTKTTSETMEQSPLRKNMFTRHWISSKIAGFD